MRRISRGSERIQARGKLEGKIALVTGGTTGIGLATTTLFHAEGARVIATGKNPATLEAARASVRGIAEVASDDSSFITGEEVVVDGE